MLKEFSVIDQTHLASFQPCVLHIRAGSLLDLSPSHGEPTPRAIATHAHEYVHYLHSMGTAAGQFYLLCNVILLRAIAAATDKDGRFYGLEVLDAENHEWAGWAIASMREVRSALTRSPFAKIGKVIRWDFGSPKTTPSDAHTTQFRIDQLGLEICATRLDGEVVNGEVKIGYSFITEGVAYQIDREIRRLQGEIFSLDDGVPAYPYQAYGALIDAWVGRETSPVERILIGNAALGFTSVGPALERACCVVRSSEQSADLSLSSMMSKAHENSADVLSVFAKVINGMGADATLLGGLRSYSRILERASELRVDLNAPELKLLLPNLGREKLYEIMASLLDAMVIQEKPDGGLIIDWIGPGHVAKDDFEASQIAVVQSAFHFNQLHLQSETLVPTSSLGPVTCPYKGACGVQLLGDEAQHCSSAPWKAFSAAVPGTPVCWYAGGVLAARRAPIEP
jgi:hypothetical protein